MKISISNIAWNEKDNQKVLEYISKKGFKGIEIAPTMIISENPYDHIDRMKEIANTIREKYNLEISSMQSIWYGQTGNIFNENDVNGLIDYTKKAIDFASAINCRNLVFGCPKNRNIPNNKKSEDVIDFFKILGDYAYEKNTFLSLEPNPAIYNTNFINYTNQAFEFVKKVNSKGFKVNIDFGTIIENHENVEEIAQSIGYINHIHISEPNLEKIKKREEHEVLKDILKKQNYDRYVSIEMKKVEDINELKDVINYIFGVFKD